jgi:signal peptidase I
MTEENKNLEQETENEEKKPSVGRQILSWVLYIGGVVLLTFLIITFVGQRTKVIGHSMMPTLSDGDNLIVDKISYRFHDPERFDIIVFPYQYEENTHYIKRIIGLPGETVQIIDSKIYINGEVLEEDYGAEPIADPGLAAEPITLGEDEYFVLGDNRNHSTDSRFADVGTIKRSDITGRAWIRIYPFNKFGAL